MVEGLWPDDFKALDACFARRPTLGPAGADPDLAQVGRCVFLRGNDSAVMHGIGSTLSELEFMARAACLS
jgi:hypothetical protein